MTTKLSICPEFSKASPHPKVKKEKELEWQKCICLEHYRLFKNVVGLYLTIRYKQFNMKRKSNISAFISLYTSKKMVNELNWDTIQIIITLCLTTGIWNRVEIIFEWGL